MTRAPKPKRPGAAHLVFTKNGQGVVHPWTFMKLETMTALYTTLFGALRVVFVAEIPR